MQRHYTVCDTFRPSYGAPSVISAKFKGVAPFCLPYHHSTGSSRLLMCPPEALVAGPHWPKPQARAIHLGDLEAAPAQNCHQDFVGHSARRRRYQ
jgi:hypothetical protein